MKLRKTGSDEQPTAPTPPTGGAVIADRFKLDMAPAAGASEGVGKTGSLIALLCSLAAIAMLGIVAALMYFNWEAIKNA